MNQLPDYLQGRQKRGLAATVSQNLGTSSPPYLSLKDNRFTLVDTAGNEQMIQTYEMDINKVMRGQAPGPYCDVLIMDVNSHISRIFYDADYDPNAQSYQPPACFSHNGVAPSKQATKPQSPTCAACPQAVWGSATSNVSGKQIPACAQYQQVAVLVAGFGMPFLLRIPPNSLKNYRAYAEQFNGRSFDMETVWTRLSFVSQGTLAFIPSGFPPPEMIALSDKLFAAQATFAMVGKLDAPIQAMLAPPGATATITTSGGQVTGVAVASDVPSTQPFIPPQQPAFASPPAAVTAPPANPAPTGRRRRSAAAAPPPEQPQQMQAPFMEQPPPETPVQPVAPPQQPQQNFGMAAGVPPNPEVQGMIDNLFGTP